MVLSFSRHMFVYVVAKMDQQAWLDAHVAAFIFFGGAPLLLIIDNLKPGVLRADLYDPKINRGYEEMARYYGTLIDPCRKGHPQAKGDASYCTSFIGLDTSFLALSLS